MCVRPTCEKIVPERLLLFVIFRRPLTTVAQSNQSRIVHVLAFAYIEDDGFVLGCVTSRVLSCVLLSSSSPPALRGLPFTPNDVRMLPSIPLGLI